MTTALRFCGREEQLDQLKTAWQHVSDPANRHTMVAVILAERGRGKTRLALEFYRWLSAHVDRRGEEGYWPDVPAMSGYNLEVNPDPHACNFHTPIPYLWWGVRAGDPGAENGVVGDALATYDRYLAPHLLGLKHIADTRERGKELAKIWLELGVDVGANLLQVDTILDVSKALFQTAKLARDDLRGRNLADSLRKAYEERTSRADAVVEDLGNVLTRKGASPAVLFLDDAQFLHHDPALPRFVERLMHEASTQRWPLLIIVTHWRREYSRQINQQETTFAGIMDHARIKTPSDNGPAAGMPGGYLPDDSYLEIDLPPVADLSGALVGELPGLTESQQVAILERSGGNPRHLEQIISFMRENEGFFEEFDLLKPLNEEGLEEILSESQDLEKVVMRRLRDAPTDIQEALGLASVQGIQFANTLVEELGQTVLGHSVGRALQNAEDPYSLVSGVTVPGSTVAAFSERLFYEVARKRLKNLKSLGGESHLRGVLKDVLRARVADESLAEQLDADDRAMSYALAAKLFMHSTNNEERHFATLALGRLVDLEWYRASDETALEAARHLVGEFDPIDIVQQLPNHLIMVAVRVLLKYACVESAESLLSPMVTDLRSRIKDAGIDIDKQRLADALNEMGYAAELREDDEAASMAYDEELIVLRELADRLNSPQNLRRLVRALGNTAMAAREQDDLDTMQRANEEAIRISRDLARQLGTLESKDHLASQLEQAGRRNLIAHATDAAKQAFEESLTIRRECVAMRGVPTDWAELSSALDLLASTAWELGDTEAAARAYDEALTISRRLANDLNTPDALHNLAHVLANISEVARAQGDDASAMSAIEESLSIKRVLAELSGTPDRMRDLFYSLYRLGRIAQAQDKSDLAMLAYEECVDINRDLVARLVIPTHESNLGLSLRLVGDVALSQGNVELAERTYEESLAIFRRLAKMHDTLDSWRDVYYTLEKIGNAASQREDSEAALQAYEEALGLSRDAASKLGIADDFQDLYVLLLHIAKTSEATGDHARATQLYEEALSTARELVNQTETPEHWWREIIVVHTSLGTLNPGQGWWQKASDICERQASERKLAAEDQWMLEDLRQRAAEDNN